MKWLRAVRLPNAWLLASLVALVLVYPFLDDRAGGRAAIAVFDLAILMLALRAARAGGYETRIGWALVVPAMLLHAGGAFAFHDLVYGAGLLAQAAFHAFVVSCLLRYMLRDEVMTVDELFAAAGLYVLMAFVFAYLYAFVEFLAPGAFYINEVNNPDGVVRWWELLYFSFTCLTSVGFGEITPVNDHARALVMVEQMMGVLYLALIISRLVTMQSHRSRRDS
ncbi:MAG: ion channel [Chiayiivirga sp.]|uniref:potassium channel family protein n=1 Tax=Chiayiivirga sp. TaxID=2041042 RepID=UPI0025BC1C60|nr:potassium channel family protein [Chiayiivirga sp.]MCI1709024.1 ion channel [Chiayiivirga sp.]MCI1729361.1 ion channel [Chiayiivirga sp.]